MHPTWPRLYHRGTARPTVGQGRTWYARWRHLLRHHTARVDKTGTYARRLEREGESLGVFLDIPGVEATNNAAERAHLLACYGVSGVRKHAVRKAITGSSGGCRCGIPVVSVDVRHGLCSSKLSHVYSQVRPLSSAGWPSASSCRLLYSVIRYCGIVAVTCGK
jgi:hypothetical protein